MRRTDRSKKEGLNEENNFDEFIDVLATIIEECGAWRVSVRSELDKDEWDTLSSALDELATALASASTNSSEQHLDLYIQSQYESILNVENAAYKVRSECDSFSLCIQDRSVLMQFCEELESILLNRRELVRVHCVCRSMIASIRQQTSIAQGIVMDVISSLSEIHTNYDDKGMTQNNQLTMKLRGYSQLFRKRCLETNHPPWTAVFHILSQIQSDSNFLDLFDGSECSSEGNTFGKEMPLDNLTPTPEFPNYDVHSAGDSPGARIINDIVLPFLNQINNGCSNASTSSHLLVGPEGSGKTHICNQIQNLAQPYSQVIRPSLPFDMMGCTVGAAENLLIALFSFAMSLQSERCIILLDDVENIFGHHYSGPPVSSTLDSADFKAGESHLSARTRSAFLSGLDALSTISSQYQGITLLLVCTSKQDISKIIDRFDQVHYLSTPNAVERRNLISSLVGVCDVPYERESLSSNPSQLEVKLLSDVVNHSIGMSYAELAQYCRQVIQSSCREPEEVESLAVSTTYQVKLLEALKQILQASMPQSLRCGVNEAFVDLTIVTAQELLSSNSSCTSSDERSIEFPLYGDSSTQAWKELERLIVLPLCRSKELENLLYCRRNTNDTGGSAKVACGGVLLTGPPGCGKSSIAYHCAKVAASLLPSVKLIDVSCTSLVHKEVGGSERAVHKLFECARSAAPCILLMDGIENIAAVRGSDNTTEGTMDRVLSTLLTELDGVDSQDIAQDGSGGIAIIAITHNINWIDPALRRPGRLEKVIELGNPNYEARFRLVLEEIGNTPFLSSSMEQNQSSEELAQVVARETEGMTGAGVIAVCSEAKMRAAREVIDTNKPLELSSRHFVTSSP